VWRSLFDLFRRRETPERVTLRFRAGEVDETTQHLDRVGALKAADEYLKKTKDGRKTIIVEIR
jgi:hypothetical protein